MRFTRQSTPKNIENIEAEARKTWESNHPHEAFKRNFEENLNALINVLGYRNDHTKTRVLIDALLVDLLGMTEINWEEYFRSLDLLKKETKKFHATKSQISKYVGEYNGISKKIVDYEYCRIFKTKNGGRFGYWILEFDGYPNSIELKIHFVSELFFRPAIRIF